MASSLLNATIKEQSNVPNKRERLVVQQALAQVQDAALSGLTAGSWDTSDPETLKEAIDRLAIAFKALLVKLDADTALDESDYEATLLP